MARPIILHCYKHCDNCKIGAHFQCTREACECETMFQD